MKNTIVVGAILFIVGGLVGFGADRVYMRRKTAANYQQADQQTEKDYKEITGTETPSAITGPSLTGQTGTSMGQNSVSVEDQKPGSMVVIQSITLAIAGWAVIHDDREGKPGRILGARRFNAGTYTGQNVELLKETEEGKVYYAMLHTDDGDKQFDYRVDFPVKDETSNAVMMRFVATAKISP